MNGETDLKKRAAEDDDLYERFARYLEAEHKGEFVAIGRDGSLIVSADQIEVMKRALERFGSGNFALRRIGFHVMGRIGMSRGY